MRTGMSLRLAIGVASLALATAGCGTTPAGSSAPSPAPASPSATAAAAASPIVATPSPEAAVLLWPAPPDPMERTVEAGLKPQPKEFMTNHVHAHLDVFVDGKPVLVPSGIGIKIDNPAVKHFDEPDGSSPMAASTCATRRASRPSTRTTRRASSTRNPPIPNRTRSESSSPSGVSSSARLASGSTARRSRSPCTSAVSSTRGTLGRSSSPTRR